MFIHLHTLKLPRSLLFHIKSTSLCAKIKTRTALELATVLAAMLSQPAGSTRKRSIGPRLHSAVEATASHSVHTSTESCVRAAFVTNWYITFSNHTHCSLFLNELVVVTIEGALECGEDPSSREPPLALNCVYEDASNGEWEYSLITVNVDKGNSTKWQNVSITLRLYISAIDGYVMFPSLRLVLMASCSIECKPRRATEIESRPPRSRYI